MVVYLVVLKAHLPYRFDTQSVWWRRKEAEADAAKRGNCTVIAAALEGRPPWHILNDLVCCYPMVGAGVPYDDEETGL